MPDTPVRTVAFVRHDQIPPSPPPVSQTGIFKWGRENLFPSVSSTILTLMSIWAIYTLLVFVLPWTFNGVWNTGSLAECREALQGQIGACFSVLTERWNQLLFGFKYPSHLYWRPTLAFVLLLVAAAPVLFFDLPRKLLIFTALYPFIAFYLIWGGTIWAPICALLGFAGGYMVYSHLVKDNFAMGLLGGVATAVMIWLLGARLLNHGLVLLFSGPLLFANGVGVLAAAWLFFRMRKLQSAASSAVISGAVLVGWLVIASSVLLPIMSGHETGGRGTEGGSFALEAVPSRDMGGFMLNMLLGVVCISLSLPLGILLALGRQSNMLIIRWICVTFIEFIRGVPLITLLFVANVVLAYFLPPGTNFDLILRVIIMITMFAAAYIAEAIRGGLAALPRGQYEAADSLGLDYAQSMRLIILPQALKISIPGIVNVAVGLFKDTTLVSVISMFDLVGMIRGPILASTAWSGVYWELFGFAAFLFFIVCYSISQYSQWLERRLATDHH